MNAWMLGLAGGIVGLDATSFPQAMISRPLVAGPLAGMVLGVPIEGAMLGAFLEIFNLGILPIGASRYPEAGTAAVAATAAYQAAGVESSSALLLALGFALLWERIAGGSVVMLRHANDLVLRAGSPPATPGTIQTRHLLAMLLDFLRGAVLTVSGAVIGSWLTSALAPHWPFSAAIARGALTVAAVTAGASALTIFGGWKDRWRLFVAGALSGVLVSWLL
jgi:PTS system mannose-specific IIC component